MLCKKFLFREVSWGLTCLIFLLFYGLVCITVRHTVHETSYRLVYRCRVYGLEVLYHYVFLLLIIVAFGCVVMGAIIRYLPALTRDVSNFIHTNIRLAHRKS